MSAQKQKLQAERVRVQRAITELREFRAISIKYADLHLNVRLIPWSQRTEEEKHYWVVLQWARQEARKIERSLTNRERYLVLEAMKQA